MDVGRLERRTRTGNLRDSDWAPSSDHHSLPLLFCLPLLRSKVGDNLVHLT